MKRMSDGMIVKQREIVLVPFPFSNLSRTKKRPVVVISNSKYNEDNNDFICCAISSSEEQFKKGIMIENKELEQGNLNYKSAIIPGKIFTILQKRVIRILGRLKIEKSKEIVRRLNFDIEIEESKSLSRFTTL